MHYDKTRLLMCLEIRFTEETLGFIRIIRLTQSMFLDTSCLGELPSI